MIRGLALRVGSLQYGRGVDRGYISKTSVPVIGAVASVAEFEGEFTLKKE